MTQGTTQSAYKAHTNLEAVRECPYCGDEVLSRGLFVHVFNSSDEDHLDRGETPEGFSVKDCPVVGHREVEMSNPTKYSVDHHRFVCDYCGEPFKGKLGLQVHLDRKIGKDGVHPLEASERDIDSFEKFPATEEGKIIVESKGDADVLPDDVDIVLAEKLDLEGDDPQVPLSELIALRDKFYADAERDTEVTAYHAAERVDAIISTYQ